MNPLPWYQYIPLDAVYLDKKRNYTQDYDQPQFHRKKEKGAGKNIVEDHRT